MNLTTEAKNQDYCLHFLFLDEVVVFSEEDFKLRQIITNIHTGKFGAFLCAPVALVQLSYIIGKNTIASKCVYLCLDIGPIIHSVYYQLEKMAKKVSFISCILGIETRQKKFHPIGLLSFGVCSLKYLSIES